jgi:hypothetical protein
LLYDDSIIHHQNNHQMKRQFMTIHGRSLWIFATISLLIFSSCKKDLPDQRIQDNTLSKSMEKTNNKAESESAAVALDWYKLQLRMILTANPATNGGINANNFAYIGIGLYESVRHGIKNSVSLSTLLNEMPPMPDKENNMGYSWSVAANAAMASLVRSLYTGLTQGNLASIDSLENAYNQQLSPAQESASFIRSQTYGRAIATAVYNWSKTDNFNVGNVGYVYKTGFGFWEPTPPAFAKGVNPFLGNARPFLSIHATGVSPAPPYPYSEMVGSDFYNMVKDVYDVSKTMTTGQRDMALYWNDLGINIGYTPQGHIMNIVIQALEQSGASLSVAAQAFVKSGLAIRESQLTVFRSKYEYSQVRPVTYIRKLIDPTWLPLIPTPPHPEFPAAHAYVTGATMQALTDVLGENFTVVDHTYDFRGFAPRHFASLNAVADESGASRRYGGIHYAPSIVVGLSEGRKVGHSFGELKLTQ